MGPDRQALARLLVFQKGKPMQTVLLKEKTIVGRNQSSNIVLSTPNSSKIHFAIIWIAQVPFLVDSSLNGTHVNNKRILNNKVALENYDEIEVKLDTYFVLVLDEHLNTKIIKDRYYIFHSQILGEGSCAKVFLAADIITGERLACKIIVKRKFKSNDNHVDMTAIEREISILSRIDHPNIITIRDLFHSSKQVYIFLDRILGGELFDYIIKNDRVPEPETKFLFYQLLIAVKYLHSENISHRDLKPENLLLETKKPYSKIILTDFGLAKWLGNSLERMQTKCGTINYLAPEVYHENGGYSNTCDCWSLGILLYVMLSGTFPFGSDRDPVALFNNVTRSPVKFGMKCGWDKVSSDAKDIVEKLLIEDPKKRMTIDEAFEHPWIRDKRDLLEKLYQRMLSKSENQKVI